MAQSVLISVSQIAADPALPQIFRLINELGTIAESRGKKTSTGSAGVGLADVVKPLEFYVWTKTNKWFMPVAILAALSIPFGIGYYMGRK